MKIKTNLRAGKQSGTVLSNSDLGISGGKGGVDDTTTASPAPAPVVYYAPPPTTIYYARCVGV